jgi:hypothetical protein
MSLDPTVAQLFAATQTAFNNATESADNWPPAGEYDLVVSALDTKPGKFKYTNTHGAQMEIPCINAWGRFTRVISKDDPDYREGQSYDFRGALFQIAEIKPDMGDNVVSRINANASRFTTHVAVILGKPFGEVKANMQGSVAAATARISDGVTMVRARVAYKQNDRDPANPYRTEYLIANLSNA